MKHLYFLTVFFCFTLGIYAQIQFQEVTGTPFDGVEQSSIAFADIDGDNDQDVLITGRNFGNQRIAKLYTNDGSGGYAEVTGTPFDGVLNSSIAFADIDGDNDPDVLITGQNTSGQRIAKLYTNDGNGGYTEVTGTPFDGVVNGSIAFADIDGDNDPDVLITGRNSSEQRIAKLYTNDGSGGYTEVTGTPFDGVWWSSIAFADIDGDNDQDVLITGQNSSFQRIAKVYTNDGNGGYTEVTGTPFDGVRWSSIAFADIDGDNDQDVLITGQNSSFQPIAKVYTNDGNGGYTEVTGTPFDGVYFSSIAFADIDGDNDQDVLITGSTLGNQILIDSAKLYTNDGSGGYTEVTGPLFDEVREGSIAFADIDGDNDQDVLITGENPSNQRIAKLYRNLITDDPDTTDDFDLAPNGVTCLCPNAAVGESGDLVIGGVTKTFTKRTRAQLDALIAADQADPQIALTCTSGITDMSSLFEDRTTFNQDISSWDMASVTNMNSMFKGATSFNQPLNDWDVSNVNNMVFLFGGISFSSPIIFNQPLDNWDTGSVTSMAALFQNNTVFNQALNSWDVSKVIDMQSMFGNAISFNQPLNDWDVSNVSNMVFLFGATSSTFPTIFNQPLENWDTGSVTNMASLFQNNTVFNQPLNDWDVSNVNNMSAMFFGADSFNQALNNWDVSIVANMSNMFRSAPSFNQDISNWCVENFINEPNNFATSSPLLQEFKPRWGEDCADATWLGTADTNWNNTNNWEPNLIPVAGANIAINSKTFQPTIDMATTIDVNNVILLDGNTLEVSGILKIGNLFHNNGSIIFKSDTNGSGQFDTFNQSISGRGEVTVERYIPAKRAFRFLATPVTTTDFIYENWQENGSTPATPDGLGTHITGGAASLGFDQSGSNSPSMFTFDNGFVPTGSESQSDAWTALPNTNSKKLKAGEAYLTFVRGDRSIDLTINSATPTNTTLKATGALQTGSLTLSSANNLSTPEFGLSDQADFYSLVGNPYQAIVDINNLDFTNVKSNFYWVWDPNLGSQGQYTTVSLPSGLNNTTSSANQFVQPSQSFFVQTIADGSASLTFNEDDKNTSGGATTIFSDQNEPSIHLLLYTTNALSTGAKESDGTLINFSENANNGLDLFDADKFLGPGENLARLHGNELISIENRAMPTDNEILALSTTGYTEDNYTFVVNATNVQDNFEAYLLDNYTGTQTQLNEGSTQINFNVDANIPESIAADRFNLVFDNTTLGINENSFGADFSLYPNPTKDGYFSIRTPNLSGEVTIKLNNMLGQIIMNENLTIVGNEVNIKAKGLSTGVYIVKLTQDEQTFSTKLIVE